MAYHCPFCLKLWFECKCPRVEFNKPEEKWGSGNTYYQGQADVLAWLDGDLGVDENAMAPICTTLSAEYACWCIGHNLSIAGALKTAEREGKAAANQWNRGRYGGFRY